MGKVTMSKSAINLDLKLSTHRATYSDILSNYEVPADAHFHISYFLDFNFYTAIEHQLNGANFPLILSGIMQSISPTYCVLVELFHKIEIPLAQKTQSAIKSYSTFDPSQSILNVHNPKFIKQFYNTSIVSQGDLLKNYMIWQELRKYIFPETHDLIHCILNQLIHPIDSNYNIHFYNFIESLVYFIESIIESEIGFTNYQALARIPILMKRDAPNAQEINLLNMPQRLKEAFELRYCKPRPYVEDWFKNLKVPIKKASLNKFAANNQFYLGSFNSRVLDSKENLDLYSNWVFSLFGKTFN